MISILYKMVAKYWVNSSFSVVVAIILIFYYDFMMKKTMNWSNWKYKTVNLK